MLRGQADYENDESRSMIAEQDQVQASNQAHERPVHRAPVSRPCTSQRRILPPLPLPGFPALFERLSWYRPRFPIFLLIRASAHLPIAALSPAVLRPTAQRTHTQALLERPSV